MSQEKQNTTEEMSFEAAMQELESIVNALEAGELPLEQSLEKFERAVQLSRTSQKKLQQAEQKVQQLLSENGKETLASVQQPPSED